MHGRKTVHVVIGITSKDGSYKLKTWRGGSLKRIKEAARKKYPDSKLSYGRSWNTYSFGAH